MDDRPLEGRRIFVTGASAGIGAEVARLAVGAGARVALVARSADRLAELASELGPAAVALPGDVTDVEQMLELGQRAATELGGLDGVVANAGSSLVGRIGDGDPNEWKWLIDLNLFGTLLTVRSALPHFGDQGARDVLLVGSTASDAGYEVAAVYSATKRGLAGAAESMRQELARRQIRVSLVEPGMTHTEILHRSVNQGIDDFAAMTPGEYRPLRAADVARVAVFVLGQPEGVALNRVVVRPTGQLR